MSVEEIIKKYENQIAELDEVTKKCYEAKINIYCELRKIMEEEKNHKDKFIINELNPEKDNEYRRLLSEYKEKDEEFNNLASKMREIFPDGRKAGTAYYWRDSVPIIAKKLKTVVDRFNVQFTEEQALAATRRYVESFNGDYRFMQLLKYFILKTDKATGDIRSDFLSLLQNPESNDLLGDNWLNEVR